MTIAIVIFSVILSISFTRYFTIKSMGKGFLIDSDRRKGYERNIARTNLVFLFLLNLICWLAFFFTVQAQGSYVS